jgi:hypothetical protein
MKFVTVTMAALLLSACSFIFPVPHDDTMFGEMVRLQMELQDTNCKDKNWDKVFDRTRYLAAYTTLREDPQADNIKQFQDALNKAYDSKNETFCDGVLKVQKTRLSVVTNAWRGR